LQQPRKPKLNFATLDESFAYLVQELGETGGPRVLSDITKEEHAALCVGFAFHQWAANPVLLEFLNKILELSPGRGGRRAKQLTDIGVAAMRGASEQRGGMVQWFKRMIWGGGE
jgi:hypothetical protein